MFLWFLTDSRDVLTPTRKHPKKNKNKKQNKKDKKDNKKPSLAPTSDDKENADIETSFEKSAEERTTPDAINGTQEGAYPSPSSIPSSEAPAHSSPCAEHTSPTENSKDTQQV